MLRLIGNVIWLLLGGIEAAIGWAIAGLILFIPIVTIPFGIQALKIARYTLWPFGSKLVSAVDSPLHGIASIIGNILWIPFGLILAVVHLVAALLFAWAHLKLAGVSLVPFGFRVVDADSSAAGEAAHAVDRLG